MRVSMVTAATLAGALLTGGWGTFFPAGGIGQPPATSRPAGRPPTGGAARVPDGVKAHRDLVYVEGGHARQKLDLYLPEGPAPSAPLPVIVWVHGGGWQSGDKSQCPPLREGFVGRGYAVVSVGYRLSGDAPFPAQIQDVRAAVRWLRAHAKQYNLAPDHIGAWGSSAGGHLVALLGTSDGTTGFDRAGDKPGVSNRVQAVCDFFGPTDLVRMAQTPGYESHARAESPESKLLGGAVLESQDKAKLANPITYVDKTDPPFLIVHGDGDPVVPLNQSRLLFEELKKTGVPVRLHTVRGAGHGGPGFSSPEVSQMVAAFFDRTLKGKAAPDGKPEPVAAESSSEAGANAAPGPQQRRPPWEQVLARRDADGNGKLSRAEFPGPPPLFDRLDRDGDGQLTREEFTAGPGGPPPV